ncbi:ABC transporter permease [Peptoclostridium litorale]|nr:iron ABC transporter permease [Peptoclostridium litorale]
MSIIASIVISIMVFILWPISEVIVKSFFPEGIFSLELYREIFTGGRRLFYNSIFVSTVSTACTIVFAVCISLYSNFSAKKMRNIIMAVLMLTMISPPFVSSLAYITLFGKRGIITYRLLGLTINPYGWHGIVLMQVFGNISLASLVIMGMMSGIDRSLIEASLDLGESAAKTIRRVVIPLSKPGIVASSFITFVKCLADFGTPIIIGGNFKVLATEAYISLIGRGDLPRAAAISVMILIPSLVVFFTYRYNMRDSKLFSATGLKSPRMLDVDFDMGIGLRSVLALFTWTFLIFMTLQYLSIFLSAISDYKSGQLIFTMEYIKSVKFSKMPSFFRSIRYAFAAGIATSVIGLLLSYYVERRNVKGSRVIDFIATLPYIMPGPLFGIGYILAFNDYPLALTGTGLIVVINCVYRQIPISTKAASAVLGNVGSDIEDAARDLGSSNMRILADIIMPLLKPAFLVSFVNTFTATMTTVGAIIFLITPSAKVATVELFNVIRDGDYGLAAVLASMIIIATIIINIIFSRIIIREG